LKTTFSIYVSHNYIAQVKLSSFLDIRKAKSIDYVKSAKVTPIISNNDILYYKVQFVNQATFSLVF